MRGQQPLLGKTLAGRYQITGHIGEGAMASVFRAADRSAPGSAEVAVKVMHPHLADDRTFAARFRQEARAASMVRHANSVAILDVGSEDGVHFIVMELVGGRDLKETLKAEGPLAPARAVKIVAEICAALHAAHQLGVVHRDLKPENVMLESSPSGDRVKVLDFGIAKLVEQKPRPREPGDSEPPVTQFGVVVGTPAYMSPEQCRGQPLDGRSDIYTCGILLYQLVTGRVPFHSDSPFEIAGKQAFEPPPPPRTHRPELSQELEDLILRTLAKSPDERPQSAAELRELLLAMAPRLGGATKPTSSLAGMSKTVPLHAIAASLDEALRSSSAATQVASTQLSPGSASAPFAPMSAAPSPLAMQPAPARGPLGTAVDPNGWGGALAPAAPPPPESPPQTAGPAYAYPTGQGVEPSPATPSKGPSAPLAALCVVLAVLAGVGLGAGLYRFVG